MLISSEKNPKESYTTVINMIFMSLIAKFKESLKKLAKLRTC